ncbi:hypothetical protein ACA910_009364 [Epithemia clementina (nom. ined.)]
MSLFKLSKTVGGCAMAALLAILPSTTSAFLRNIQEDSQHANTVSDEKRTQSYGRGRKLEGSSCLFSVQEGLASAFDEFEVTPYELVPLPDEDMTCNCRLENGNTYELQFPDNSPSCQELIDQRILVSSESVIRLQDGAYIDHAYEIIVLPPGPLLLENDNYSFRRRSLIGTAIGSKTFLVVKIMALNDDEPLLQTESQISDEIFGTFGDEVNLKTQYAKCSRGLFEVLPANDLVGGPNNEYSITNGVVTVNVDKEVTDGRLALSNAAMEKLKEMFNLENLAVLANNFMFSMPPNTVTDGRPDTKMNIAVATTNGSESWFRGDFILFPTFQMHEIGHNLDLGHASEPPQDYGDRSGAMGITYRMDDWPKLCFNAANMYDLGWYSDPNGLLEIAEEPTSNVFVNLFGFANSKAGDSGITLIKIVNPSLPNSNNTKNVYVQYNWQHEYNADTQEGGNQVVVVEKPEERGGWTFLMALLDPTTTPFVSEGFFATDCDLIISVMVLDTSLDGGVAEVRIQAVGSGCASTAAPSMVEGLVPAPSSSPRPSMSLSPSSSPRPSTSMSPSGSSTPSFEPSEIEGWSEEPSPTG